MTTWPPALPGLPGAASPHRGGDAVASHVGVRPLLCVRGLHLRRGDRAVLRGVDLRVEQGEFVALMGLSGAGKTTVLRAIAGLESFDRGRVEVDGVSLVAGPRPSERALRGLREKVGMVFQFHHLFEHLSALHNVTLAPIHAAGLGRAEAEARALRLLHDLGVGGQAGCLPRQLSGGEAQRVAIARALAMDPPLLLLDEPTASLDPARRGGLGASLRRLAAQGRTLLCSTHDDDFVRDHATRVVVLSDGEVVEEGDPDQVLRAPTHIATRRLLRSHEAGAR